MTITTDVDTYATLAEANAYFESLYGFPKWAPLTDPVKEQVLRSAFQQENNLCAWYGNPVDEEQAGAFPRTPDANPTPQAAKDAQCEIAYAIVDTGSVSTDPDDPLTELKAGSVTMKFKTGVSGNPLINDLVVDLLRPYGLCSGNGSTKLIPIGIQ